MWQLLLELLTDKSCQQFISWTGDGWEFKLTDPDEVSALVRGLRSAAWLAVAASMGFAPRQESGMAGRKLCQVRDSLKRFCLGLPAAASLPIVLQQRFLY